MQSNLRQRRSSQVATPHLQNENGSQQHSLVNTSSLLFKTLCPLLVFCATLILRSQLPSLRLPTEMTSMDRQQVLVIGGGLAGLSATVEALKAGARVTLIDKQKLGGNSAKATSGINGVSTPHQIALGVKDDSIDLFVEDIVKSGQGKTNRELAQVLSANSAQAVTFLEHIINQKLSNVAILGGHSRPRTHRLPTPPGSKPMPIGFLVISALKKFLLDEKWKNQLQITEGTIVTDLELEYEKFPNGTQSARVTTVKIVPSVSEQFTEPTILTPHVVVLTSGGFSADLEKGGLVSQYSSFASKCPFTTNGNFSTGDLLKIGQRLGFDTVDLDQIQLHPTSFVDPQNPNQKEKFLCPEMVRGSGALLINRNGRRFVNELEKRDVVSNAIYEVGNTPYEWNLSENVDIDHHQFTKIAVLLMNSNIRSTIGESTFDFYKARGLIKEMGKRAEVAEKLGFDLEIFSSTLDSYNNALHGKVEDQFGKTSFATEFLPSDVLYVAYVTPAVHYTMGGIKINSDAQVLMKGAILVNNLFAAGEVTGGVHGANRLGGNGMLESVVFGRLAGQNAANV